MRKWFRKILVGLCIIAPIIAVVAAFLYFRVADRIKPQVSETSFRNEQLITRLDSGRLSPDSLAVYISSLMARAKVYGMGISIVNDYKLVYQQYFGMRNEPKGERFEPGTVFYGASFSKVILADVVLQLAEEKVLHLDTPVYRYLKHPLHTYKTNKVQQLFGSNYIDYGDLEHDERYKKITARMCLNHSTGFPNWRWIEPDGKLRIKFEPGTRYSYSGEGIFLVQMVIEELTGKDLETLAVEEVFMPLKMDRSSFVWQRGYEGYYAVGHGANGNNLRIPKPDAPNGAGSLSTTLEDYTKFFMAILKQTDIHHKQLITTQILIRSKQQFGPNALIDTNENDSIQLSYGFGVGVYQTPYGPAFFKEGHDDGWQHYFVGFPGRGLGLVMMCNSDNAESIFKPLIEYSTGNEYTPWYWEGYIPIAGEE